MGNVARTVGTVVNGVSRCMCSLVLFLHPVNMYFCCYALSTLKVSCWLWWLDLSGWPDIALKLEKGEYLIGTQSCLQVLSPPVDAFFPHHPCIACREYHSSSSTAHQYASPLWQSSRFKEILFTSMNYSHHQYDHMCLFFVFFVVFVIYILFLSYPLVI